MRNWSLHYHFYSPQHRRSNWLLWSFLRSSSCNTSLFLRISTNLCADFPLESSTVNREKGLGKSLGVNIAGETERSSVRWKRKPRTEKGRDKGGDNTIERGSLSITSVDFRREKHGIMDKFNWTVVQNDRRIVYRKFWSHRINYRQFRAIYALAMEYGNESA